MVAGQASSSSSNSSSSNNVVGTEIASLTLVLFSIVLSKLLRYYLFNLVKIIIIALLINHSNNRPIANTANNQIPSSYRYRVNLFSLPYHQTGSV